MSQDTCNDAIDCPVGSGLQHRPDHHEILTSMPAFPPGHALDAVVVPSCRSAEHLSRAVDVAKQLDAPIVIITSTAWEEETSRDVLNGQPGAVVKMSPIVRRDFFGLGLARLSPVDTSPYADTAVKRNVGLRLGRRLGWNTILFLDDDIQGLPVDAVASALGALRATGLRAVGWELHDFPDNSVVCHLRRLVRLDQKIFVSGGALLVDLIGELPFFPPVYNEDWLFLHDWVAAKLVASAGAVGQESFDPFESSARATREEFGDVLAEGLYDLVHRGQRVDMAGQRLLWMQVQRGRLDMLEQVRSRLAELRVPTDLPDRPKEWISWEAARGECLKIKPDELATYARQWRRDLLVWKEQLNQLPASPDLGSALRSEGLADAQVSGGLRSSESVRA